MQASAAASVRAPHALTAAAAHLPFLACERDRRVAHRHHQVHKGHTGERRPEDVRCVVHDVAHKQTASRAAFAREPVGHGDSLGNESPRAVDKIEKGIALMEVLARGLIPAMVAHLAAAADVREREDDAAVDKRQVRQRLVEARVDAHTVTAVADRWSGAGPGSSDLEEAPPAPTGTASGLQSSVTGTDSPSRAVTRICLVRYLLAS